MYEICFSLYIYSLTYLLIFFTKIKIKKKRKHNNIKYSMPKKI